MSSSQYEEWIYLREDGAIVYHFELDGYAYLRNGAQARNEVFTSPDELKKKHPQFYEEALKLLKKRQDAAPPVPPT